MILIVTVICFVGTYHGYNHYSIFMFHYKYTIYQVCFIGFSAVQYIKCYMHAILPSYLLVVWWYFDAISFTRSHWSNALINLLKFDYASMVVVFKCRITGSYLLICSYLINIRSGIMMHILWKCLSVIFLTYYPPQVLCLFVMWLVKYLYDVMLKQTAKLL